jgi:hypothetical protein
MSMQTLSRVRGRVIMFKNQARPADFFDAVDTELVR